MRGRVVLRLHGLCVFQIRIQHGKLRKPHAKAFAAVFHICLFAHPDGQEFLPPFAAQGLQTRQILLFRRVQLFRGDRGQRAAALLQVQSAGAVCGQKRPPVLRVAHGNKRSVDSDRPAGSVVFQRDPRNRFRAGLARVFSAFFLFDQIEFHSTYYTNITSPCQRGPYII